MTSKVSQNSGTSNYKNVLGHVVDALAAIVAADNTARNNAVTAAAAAVTTTLLPPENWVRTGAFAYGIGGASFLAGFAIADSKSGVVYYDYMPRHPYIILMWNGNEWQQVSLSINAIS